MSFIADKQTVDDLNLLGKYKANSIYNLFNRVSTKGGERLLLEMFQHPFSDAEAMNKRSNMFHYFQQKNLKFPFKTAVFEVAESYLGVGVGIGYPLALANLMTKKLKADLIRDEQYSVTCQGLTATANILRKCRDFMQQLSEEKLQHNPYQEDHDRVQSLLQDTGLLMLQQEQNIESLSIIKIARYDYLLRHTLYSRMVVLLEDIYKLDVYIAVSKVAYERDFSFAVALPHAANGLRTSALWHPYLIKGIANTVVFNEDQNMMFLTGANMAGKSTLMKAFGVAVYLAHMGFPVAARDMQFSVMDGIYSSINVADDLNMGHSHFYAEVLRVKKVAEEVATGKNLVVLFDELFKGTNVKDAFDATLSVTKSFSEYRNCFYIISTHIIEVGEALQSETDNLKYSYLPTIINGSVPEYTYQLKEGITTDRQGMIIIENEGILEILKSN